MLLQIVRGKLWGKQSCPEGSKRPEMPVPCTFPTPPTAPRAALRSRWCAVRGCRRPGRGVRPTGPGWLSSTGMMGWRTAFGVTATKSRRTGEVGRPTPPRLGGNYHGSKRPGLREVVHESRCQVLAAAHDLVHFRGGRFRLQERGVDRIGSRSFHAWRGIRSGSRPNPTPTSRGSRDCCQAGAKCGKAPNPRWDASSNPGEGAGAGFLVLRGAHRTQHHSGAHQHIRRPTFRLG
jgi:hypothetical protein